MEAIDAEATYRSGDNREDAAFLAALDQAPLPMWLSNPDYEGTYFNKAWLEFRGRSLAEEIGGGWISGIHPNDMPGLDSYASALLDGRPFQVEYRLRRHDGVWRWFLDTGKPRLSDCGRLIGFIGTCVDITDRRHTEEALRRTEARLQLAQEGAALGIYDWDMVADRITWSPEMFRLYGLSPDLGAQARPDALISAWLDRLHPGDRDRCASELSACMESRDASQLTMSFRVNHPEAGPRWIEGRGRLLRDEQGRPLRLIGVNFDVTEQREREAARERAAMMLRMSIEVAAIGTWELDPASLEVVTSPRTDALFDIAPHGGPRPMADYLARIHSEDREALRAGVQDAMIEGGETARVYRVLGKENETRWVSTRGRTVKLADGSTRLIGAMTDITAAKRHEAEREAELARRQMLLTELNHRMKNNLHLILSMLRLEANRSGHPECFESATKRIEAVADLHAQLGFSDGAGRLCFGAYIEDLAEKLRRSVLVQSDIKLDCEAVPVELDLDRAVPLGLVVNELVTNAIKHAFPQGTGRITLRLEHAPEAGLRVIVADDGVGPSECVTETVPGSHRNSGLGAGLVAGLCGQIGAKLESRSLPGMRHEITLPPL
ncbi:PAS domain-containing protein [uncultured Limimaricola sp.]|uniref:PAS domain-containing protein n=1 Tax=uncultured Limimaricola sp. TaxID=2211667 RepID=UPI0030F910BA